MLVAARRPVVAALDSDSEAEDTVDEELKKSSLVESPPSKATRAEGLRPIRRRVARSGGALRGHSAAFVLETEAGFFPRT